MADAAHRPEKVIVREMLTRSVLEEGDDGDFHVIASKVIYDNEYVFDKEKALRGVTGSG